MKIESATIDSVDNNFQISWGAVLKVSELSNSGRIFNYVQTCEAVSGKLSEGAAYFNSSSVIANTTSNATGAIALSTTAEINFVYEVVGSSFNYAVIQFARLCSFVYAKLKNLNFRVRRALVRANPFKIYKSPRVLLS